jgi:hypothetical protein
MKGLCIAPALAGLDGCWKSCPPSAGITVNVVLHGAYVLELNQKLAKAFVRIPYVESHVYTIGPWLLEEQLEDTPPGHPLQIQNLIGSPTLPTMTDIDSYDTVVFKQLTQVKPPKIEIELPMPKSVFLARNARLVDEKGNAVDFFETLGPLRKQPQRVAMTLVLTYRLDLEATFPSANKHKWLPTLNLHIFAEPCVDPTAQHILDAFHAVRSMYKELSSLEYSDDWCPNNGTTVCNMNYERSVPTSLPPGLCGEEILSLAEREQQVVRQCTSSTPHVSTGGHHAGTCLHVMMIPD